MSYSHAVPHILLSLLFILGAECNWFNTFNRYNTAGSLFGRQLITSGASAVPGALQNAIDPSANTGSSFGSAPVPQVLTNAINNGVPVAPPAAIPATSDAHLSSVNPAAGGSMPSPALMNLISASSQMSQSANGAFGNPQGGGMTNRQRPFIPVTGNIKRMVNKWAKQLGHQAWYEAHGCVDPTTALHGRHGQLASVALMMGCNNHQAHEACDAAQMAKGGTQGARTRMMMDIFMSKSMKRVFEKCLTPSSLMSGLGGMMPRRQNPYGPVPPPGAAGHSTPTDCSAISGMLMMGPGAGEGLMTGEHMESIGKLRNRYMKMECQESFLMGSLPYRLCCPGHVAAPTIQEAMMMRSLNSF